MKCFSQMHTVLIMSMKRVVISHIVGRFQKRTIKVIILFLLTLGLFLSLYNWRYSDTQVNGKHERWRLPDNITTSFKPQNDDGLTHFERTLTEDDVREVPCDDINSITSAQNSELYIPKNQFRLGDKIKLSLTVFDGYGKAKTSGGDQFRAVIKTPAKQAYASGIVTDYDNGTYGITFEALWTGNATIEVTLAYTKEAFAALFRLTLKNFPIVQIGGTYSHNGVRETVLCHPDPSLLASYHICDNKTITACRTKQATPRQNYCNFTSWNDGFPYFCARPRHKALRCVHMMYIRDRKDFDMPAMTVCEQWITERCHQRLKKALSVTILPDKNKMNVSVIPVSQASCAKYSRAALWSTNRTSGFFFKGHWQLRHCKGVDIKNKHSCLKDRRLYVIGDSTMRQWYLNIRKRYTCIQYTEKWTYRKWYDLSSCRNSELNFTATYAIHGLPFNIRRWVNISSYLTSISQRLDKIPDNENAIFVFHVYQHMIYFNPRYFKLKMEVVRSSAVKLLDRNKYAKIMVKAPHVFKNNRDVFNNVYTRILYEVFHNLHDRIIFLNNRDATIAVEETDIHPRRMVVEAMVDQMIVFACN